MDIRRNFKNILRCQVPVQMDKKYDKIQRYLSLDQQKEIIRIKAKPFPQTNRIISQ